MKSIQKGSRSWSKICNEMKTQWKSHFLSLKILLHAFDDVNPLEWAHAYVKSDIVLSVKFKPYGKKRESLSKLYCLFSVGRYDIYD